MWIFLFIVYPDRCTICVAALGNSEKVQQRLSFWDDVYGRSNCFYMLNVMITHVIYLRFFFYPLINSLKLLSTTVLGKFDLKIVTSLSHRKFNDHSLTTRRGPKCFKTLLLNLDRKSQKLRVRWILWLILYVSFLLGFKMSCMKRSVCTEPSVEIVNPGDEISSRYTVKVIRSFSKVTATAKRTSKKQ